MQAKQPIDMLPDTKDASLRGAWLNKGIAGPRDYSTDGDDMTIFGAPVFERVGADFDGAADYLRRDEADWRNSDEQGTVTAWIKRGLYGAIQVIWSSAREVIGSNYLQLRIQSDRLAVSQDNGLPAHYRGSTYLLADRWYHVAVVSTGDAYALYVNGQLETFSSETGTAGEWLADTPDRDNVVIGVLRTGVLANYFNGQIKDVRYYSEAKTADWVKHEYEKGVPDSSLKLLVRDGMQDLSKYDKALTRNGGVIVGHEMLFDGTDDYIDCGDVGNLQVISLWVNPDSDTEEILQVDAGKHITVSGGTVTYTGLTAVATYVNGVAGTTLVADLWQHLVCIVQQVDGDNFELGREGTNYGDIKLKDVRVFDEVKSADWIKELYRKTRGYY